ncbi:MAG: glutamate formiminotransferase [Actinobacteria bacterium]|nr:glutamate formiminotransferase [Actinomycetota bacterium]MBW3650242.1 glutamate formiminotransferase [Actinomycetota bacterium]
MLESVINVSEGQRQAVVAAIAAAAGRHLLDVHLDPDHHRSVLTLAGPEVEDAAFAVVAAAVAQIDLRRHAGVHPRLGAADVVPFVPLGASTLSDAVTARDRVAERVAAELGVPCFRYGPERSLPEVRRRGFVDLAPDTGPAQAHPTAGATCVGARPVLVAYNLWLARGATIDLARRIAADLRSPTVRALGLVTGETVQVSCNLVAPTVTGPEDVFDAVAAQADVARAELVGLVPAAVLEAVPRARWAELDLSQSATIEARLREAGLDGGRFESGVS